MPQIYAVVGLYNGGVFSVMTMARAMDSSILPNIIFIKMEGYHTIIVISGLKRVFF